MSGEMLLVLGLIGLALYSKFKLGPVGGDAGPGTPVPKESIGGSRVTVTANNSAPVPDSALSPNANLPIAVNGPSRPIQITASGSTPVLGSLTVGGGNLVASQVYGSEVPVYDSALVESGSILYTAPAGVMDLIKKGIWSKDVANHAFYWASYWLKRNMGMEGLAPLWAGDPIANLKSQTGFSSFDEWAANWKAVAAQAGIVL